MILRVWCYHSLVLGAARMTRISLAVALVVILIVGMRNAWDMATFMIMRNREQ